MVGGGWWVVVVPARVSMASQGIQRCFAVGGCGYHRIPGLCFARGAWLLPSTHGRGTGRLEAVAQRNAHELCPVFGLIRAMTHAPIA